MRKLSKILPSIMGLAAMMLVAVGDKIGGVSTMSFIFWLGQPDMPESLIKRD